MWLAFSLPARGALEWAIADLQVPQQPLSGTYTAANNAFGALRFNAPMVVASAPGDDQAVYVAERGGFIRRVDLRGEPTSSTFMRIPVRLNTSGEGGLLGLAFHPDYAANGRFFTFYTLTTDSDAGQGFHTRVAEFRRSASNPFKGDPRAERILFTQYNEASNHNGGDLHFGPDGYLYVAVGDEGLRDDLLDNSQRIDRDFFSGILRLDVDQLPGSLAPNPHPANPQGYSIPPDNPFVHTTQFQGRAVAPDQVRTEFWAIGLRNPWRFSFDPHSGTLIAGDVGQGTWEEINVITRGGNYGWNGFEGPEIFRANAASRLDGEAIDPIFSYPHTRRNGHTQTGISVTGGIVYRGERYPDLFGSYLFTDWGTGVIWALDSVQIRQRPEDLRIVATDSTNGIVGFGVDPTNGDPLLIDMADGVIRRLERQTLQGDRFPQQLSQVGVFQDLETLKPAPGVIPYEINAPFWSDFAIKRRWFAVREGLSAGLNPFGYSTDGPWSHAFCDCAPVWIKHFDLETTRGVPESRIRLETRLLVRSAHGVFGATYRWNEAQDDAELVPLEGATATLSIRDGEQTTNQEWVFPSRAACLQCHTAAGGYALGFSTAQMNRSIDYGDGPENQIDALSRVGYLNRSTPPSPDSRFTRIPSRPRLASPSDPTASTAERVRAYLHANCSPCHQPFGPGLGDWDARADVPNLERGLILGPLTRPHSVEARALIEPGAPGRSEIFRRITTRGPGRMPPIGSNEVDPIGRALFQQWIQETLKDWRAPESSFDAWLDETTGSTSTRVYHPESDTDHDGWTTYWEYLQDSSPDHPTPPLTLSLGTQPTALQIPRWPRVGLEILLEAAPSPEGPWTTIDQNRPEWFHDPMDPTDEPASYPLSQEASRQYYRLRLHAP